MNRVHFVQILLFQTNHKLFLYFFKQILSKNINIYKTGHLEKIIRTERLNVIASLKFHISSTIEER